MIQATGTNVGKSLLVAGLARHFARRGLRVAPFKPQNMSNNAAATPDGGEIGRAQMLQARAAGVPATVHMNPVLLKPQSEIGSQIVVQGRIWGRAAGREYAAWKPKLMAPVLQSFANLCAEADLVIVEGAGSPAEINLRSGDIANMGFARAARVPVILAADIDRGGVIANLVGTRNVLAPEDAAQVAGFLVNKFRGDVSLFEDGIRAVEERTGWPSLGVVPWFADATRLPAEDTLGLPGRSTGDGVKIVVPRLPHIANFDDIDPLRLEPGVSVNVIPVSDALPGDTDIVLLPGSKSTIADLTALTAAGWDVDLAAHRRRGGQIVGLCGGYQMLGRSVADPGGVEGPVGKVDGLGLLDVETVLAGTKTTRLSEGTSPAFGGVPVSGYRIHMGETDGPDCARPVVDLAEGPDGAVSRDGLVMGTYLHGFFGGDDIRGAFLSDHGVQAMTAYEAGIDTTLHDLADHVAAALDLDQLMAIASTARTP
ncbi:MAG: cobyric acid synthase [Pseudomonadota bacterium]